MEGLSNAHLATLRKRMAEIDTLSPAWRTLIHEFGWTFVAEFYRAGLKPSVARHLIEATLRGAWEIRERRRISMAVTVAGERVSDAMNDIGMPGSGHALAASIYRRGGLLLSRQPTNAMVLASMTALYRRPELGKIDTETKHRFRLKDALEAAAREEHHPQEEADG